MDKQETINTDKIEINEPEVIQKTEPKVPTKEDLKATGWSKEELESAEKRGMIQKEDPKKQESDAPELPLGEKKEDPQKANEKPKSSLPDFTFKTPEQEKAFMDAFGPGTPQRGIYFRMKNERKERQRAEQERDRILSEKKALEDRIRALESNRVEPPAQTDENGNPIDPDAAPLTKKEFLELQEKQRQDQIRIENETRAKGQIVADSLRDQEEYMKSIHPDYDKTVNMAKEVLNNLDELVEDPKVRSKVIRMVRDLQIAAANADQYGIEDYNAADISYEIGKLHPNYGKESANGEKSDTNGHIDTPDKANGSRLSPDQMKRIEQNTQRRNSSASIPGGSRRVISADDVTIADLLKMSPDQRLKFRQNHPDKYAKLRG